MGANRHRLCVVSSHFPKDFGVERSVEDPGSGDLPLPLHGFLRFAVRLGK